MEGWLGGVICMLATVLVRGLEQITTRARVLDFDYWLCAPLIWKLI